MTKSMLVDMDGDGKLDLLFIDSDGSWRFYRNKGGYEFDSIPLDIKWPACLVKPDALDYTWSIQRTEWQFMGTANRGLGTPVKRITTQREEHTRQIILDMNGDGRATWFPR